MESQEIYSDDSSYHNSQDSDYVYDSQIVVIVMTVASQIKVNWMMMPFTLMSRRIFMQNSYTKHKRYFNDGNILAAEEKLHDIKYNPRKPRISPSNI